jgi:hypothetical protein
MLKFVNVTLITIGDGAGALECAWKIYRIAVLLRLVAVAIAIVEATLTLALAVPIRPEY